jgi:hypothetical protein
LLESSNDLLVPAGIALPDREPPVDQADVCRCLPERSRLENPVDDFKNRKKSGPALRCERV